MSWKRNNFFFNTVRFRTSLWYAFLFATSSLLLFLAVYYVLKSGMIDSVDKQLMAFSRELEDGYFKATGNAEKIAALEAGFRRESYYQGTKRIFFRLLDSDGKTLAESGGKSWERLGKVPGYRKYLILGEPATAPVPSRSSVRLLDRPLTEGRILETGIDLSTEDDMLKIYFSVFFSVFGGLLLISSVVGWVIAGRAMRGVARVSAAAAAISRGDFSRRAAAANDGTEVENLVTAFNDMQSKIESLIFELKEVSDNVAHDLRTPVTRIRGIVETTVNSKPTVAEYQLMSGEIVEECDRLIEMINTMLEITRTDAGTVELAIVEVDMLQLSRQACNLFQPLAEMKDIEFHVDIPDGEAIIRGDLSRLQRMVSNLLDNAIKYTSDGGRVEVSAQNNGKTVCISIKDSGSGISTEDQKHIFDRFFRGDSSRSQAGNGLGLSLVQAIVRAHKGVIEVESAPGKGSVFTVIFPAV